MKIVQKLSIVSLFLLLFVSCSEDENVADAIASGDGVISATVKGENFESLKAVTKAIVKNTSLSLSGANQAGDVITIGITNYSGAGTYSFGGNSANTMVFSKTTSQTGWAVSLDTGSGTVTVSKDDGSKVEGTFSFDATSDDFGDAKITNGKFNVAVTQG